MKFRACSAALLALATTTGCDLLTSEIEGQLPPFETILLPKPSDRAPGSTAEQAACADGNDVATAIEARIDGLNASLENERGLLQALYAATPVGVAGVATYDVDADGRTMNVQLVTNDDGDVVITATIELAPYVTGTYNADASEGAIVITPEEGDPINSAWKTTDGTFDLARVEGVAAVASAYTNDGEKSRLAVTGADITTLVAVWGLDDGAGAAIEGTNEAGCWSAGDAAADLCTVLCDQSVLDALPTP